MEREIARSSSWASREGRPNPLGASWIAEEEAWNFAIYSEHGGHVTWLLYADADLVTPDLTQPLDHLRNKSGPLWHCRGHATSVTGARVSAYPVEGLLRPPPSTSRLASTAERRSGQARTLAWRPSA